MLPQPYPPATRILPLHGQAAFLVMLPVEAPRTCGGCQSLHALFVVRYVTEPGSVLPQFRDRCLDCDGAEVLA